MEAVGRSVADHCGALGFECSSKASSVEGLEAIDRARAKRSDTTIEGTEGRDQEGGVKCRGA